MKKFFRNLIRRKNPRSIIAEELNMAEVNLVYAKLHKEELQTEVNKQTAICTKYENRIKRLKEELQTLISNGED